MAVRETLSGPRPAPAGYTDALPDAYFDAMTLHRRLVEKPWGRTLLPAGFPSTQGASIGEIIHDAPAGIHLPIIAKHIFTAERLSIQVHPDDSAARRRGLGCGKTECWLILAAEPGATLALGTVRPLDAGELRAAAADGSIEALVHWRPVFAGDFFLVPAGTVHAIGAGVTLVEIQQNADITYRLHDYGRPRELHLDDGVAVARAVPYDEGLARSVRDERAAGDMLLAQTPWFRVDYRTRPGRTPAGDPHERGLVIPVAGDVSVGGRQIGVGDCLLVDGAAELELAPGAAVLSAMFDAG